MSSIAYTVYTASDGDDMARVLAAAFSQRDPPAVAVGITAAEFEGFVRLYCPRAETQGLTIVARAADTREMVGALLAEDSASAMPDGMAGLSAKFNPIFDILSELESEYRGDETLRPGESVHIYLLGVAQAFAGRGVAHQLVATCLDNAARRGYLVTVTEATSRTSQHIFRKLGFTERVRRSYADHRVEGQAVFAAIADQGGPILMEKPLQAEERER